MLLEHFAAAAAASAARQREKTTTRDLGLSREERRKAKRKEGTQYPINSASFFFSFALVPNSGGLNCVVMVVRRLGQNFLEMSTTLITFFLEPARE